MAGHRRPNDKGSALVAPALAELEHVIARPLGSHCPCLGVGRRGRRGTGARAGSLLGEMSTVAGTGWPDMVHAELVILMAKGTSAGAT
jgi:hypothetical protein